MADDVKEFSKEEAQGTLFHGAPQPSLAAPVVQPSVQRTSNIPVPPPLSVKSVEKGTPLLRLSNPSATLGYMNQETAIVEQINNLRSLKLSLEKDQRDLKESLIDSENSLAEVERNYKVDSVLYSKDIIARNDFVERRESFKYLKNKRDFMNQNVIKSSQDNLVYRSHYGRF